MRNLILILMTLSIMSCEKQSVEPIVHVFTDTVYVIDTVVVNHSDKAILAMAGELCTINGYYASVIVDTLYYIYTEINGVRTEIACTEYFYYIDENNAHMYLNPDYLTECDKK